MNNADSNEKDKRTAKAFGQIHFYQACLPPLLPGKYKVTIEQKVEEIRQGFISMWAKHDYIDVMIEVNHHMEEAIKIITDIDDTLNLGKHSEISIGEQQQKMLLEAQEKISETNHFQK